MKRFILSLLSFLLVLFIFICLLGRDHNNRGETSDFMAAIIDKHALLEKTPPPRLIFIGGSNLAFGIDSKRIEDTFGLPVVNMGLHGGLGLEFLLKEIKLAARPKDILILSVEYFLNVKGDYRLQNNAVAFFPALDKIIKRDYYVDLKEFLCYGITRYAKKNIARVLGLSIRKDKDIEANLVYSRRSFNVYGDVIGHLDKPSPKELRDRSLLTYRKWEGIDILNEFAGYAESKNIRLFYLYPSYPESEFMLNREVILKFAADLKNELHIQLINTPEDSVFPDSLFYDTIYHLNKEGIERRTTSIIGLLKNALLL